MPWYLRQTVLVFRQSLIDEHHYAAVLCDATVRQRLALGGLSKRLIHLRYGALDQARSRGEGPCRLAMTRRSKIMETLAVKAIADTAYGNKPGRN